MRHAVRADIASNELSLQAVAGDEFGVFGLRLEPAEIDAICYDIDLCGIDATSGQFRLEGVGERNDASGSAIKEQLEPLKLMEPKALSGWRRPP